MALNPERLNLIRNIWTNREIVCMLEIFREEKILDLFDGKRYKNTEIYKLVEKKMVEKGFLNKSADQIKNKWKALKTQYNNCVKNNSRSGMDRSECEYFTLLEDILGIRPSSSLEGIDSDIIEVEENVSNEELGGYLQSPVSSLRSESRSAEHPEP